MLIHGDIFEQEFGSDFDLIIADIPYVEVWNYDFVLFKLASFLNKDGVLAVTVDTSSIVRAFIKYILSYGQYLDLKKLDMFEDGTIWGNVLILSLKDSDRQLEQSNIIRLQKGIGSHPNSKDGHLYRYIVERFSKEGDSILDPFMGEGNTGRICQDLNRKYTGVEINKQWFDIAVKNIGEPLKVS